MINDYKPNCVEGATSRWSKINPGVRVTGWVGVDVSLYIYILIGPCVKPRRRIVITAAMDDTPRERECDINNDSVILSSLIKIVRTQADGDTGHGSNDFTTLKKTTTLTFLKSTEKKTTARLSSYNINLRNNLESVIYICISPYHSTRHNYVDCKKPVCVHNF